MTRIAESFLLSRNSERKVHIAIQRKKFFITFKSGNMIYNILTLILRVLGMKCNADWSQSA